MIDNTSIESNIIVAMQAQFGHCETQDEVNKVYRQSRNWVRYHCYFGKACDEAHAKELNRKFKEMRWNRLEELGYETWRTKNENNRVGR